MNWNFDISAAPRGKNVTTIQPDPRGNECNVVRFVPDRVILATRCGKVTLSQWLPAGKERKTGRWQMLGDGEEPIAWFPWPAFPDLNSEDQR